ncbi:1146_t:CDS:1, partial [Cetraspora pellucida]
EVYEMLEVTEVLTSNFSTEISPEDIVDVFSHSNTEKIRKNEYNQLVLCRGVKLYEEKEPTILIPKETAQIALNDLVSKGLIKQEIRLQKSKTTQYLSCSVIITGIREGAKEYAQMNSWKYW